MSKKRYINDNIWEDNYIIELSTQEKLLFIYLLTNNRLSICWIYEISIRKIEMETGLSSKIISDTFKKFEKDWKMYYRDWILLITNFLKNQSLNDNMKKWIERELEELWWEKLSIFSKTKGFERLWKALESFDILYLTLLNFTLPNSTQLENSSKEEWEQALEVIEIEKEIKEYWDQDINKTISYLSKMVWCTTFRETQKQQRIYWKHLFNLWKQLWADEFNFRLKEILSDHFKAKNCNKLAYLYWEIKSYIHSPIIEPKPKQKPVNDDPLLRF